MVSSSYSWTRLSLHLPPLSYPPRQNLFAKLISEPALVVHFASLSMDRQLTGGLRENDSGERRVEGCISQCNFFADAKRGRKSVRGVERVSMWCGEAHISASGGSEDRGKKWAQWDNISRVQITIDLGWTDRTRSTDRSHGAHVPHHGVTSRVRLC